MRIITVAQPDAAQKEAIYSLWNNEYPARIAYTDMSGLDAYLATLQAPTHYFLQNEDDIIKGWAFKFIRKEEYWFAIIIARDIQGRGYGRMMLDTLKAGSEMLNGWVVDRQDEKCPDGSLYHAPLGFYIKNGFIPLPEVRLETEKISAVKIVWKK